MIERARHVCADDERLDAALMYGSFAAGEGDAYSDIEFWLFFEPGMRDRVDRRAWCARIAPLLHLVCNEFGTDVAIFEGLIRGEFHFATTDDIASVGLWPGRGAPVDRMVVLDRGGRLRPVLERLPERAAVPREAADVVVLCGRFANWLLLAHDVSRRGETLRAWDALGHVQRHLLWMARLAENSARHWLTPSRRVEWELPEPVVADLRGAAPAGDPDSVHDGLRAAWRLGRHYWTDLAARFALAVPDQLFREIDSAL